jgi:anti-sigma factor RsiW
MLMQTCRNHNETLMLDVLDELTDPRVRREWEGHLASCSGCRTEKARMLHLLGQVRASGTPPELSDAEAQRMTGAVSREIRNRPGRVSRTGWSFRLVPALAAAGALIITVMAGYWLQGSFFGSGRLADLTAESQLEAPDLDVVKHLDLLRDMDTIEKLIQIVDIPDNELSPGEPNPETQGTQPDGNSHVVA